MKPGGTQTSITSSDLDPIQATRMVVLLQYVIAAF